MDKLSVATFNTRGIPVLRSRLRGRYGVIGREFEGSDLDVVNVQEVLTYYHLRQLVRWMPSYRWISYRRSLVGPAGGLVTFSRRPVEATDYVRFPSRFKGTLVTRLPVGYVVNTHPTANVDGDWSESNRFYDTHRAQLAVLADVVDALPGPAIVCGDFNVPRDSDLFRSFIAKAFLMDAFAGACPPTFRAEYLPPGRTSQCIDFVLVTGAVNVESADLMFTDRPDISDHLGLSVRLSVSG
ncbi:endonuclease/exonuclease/phosphatase family protein [Kribbella sp. NPDC050470]|uniref:endonuclease/exonuclease/phosphatase family protein n=1 Tax=unclassified Kribbella TaxID=2644121 RepID=UPI0037B608EA